MVSCNNSSFGIHHLITFAFLTIINHGFSSTYFRRICYLYFIVCIGFPVSLSLSGIPYACLCDDLLHRVKVNGFTVFCNLE